MGDSMDMSSLNTLKGATSYISSSLHDAVKLRIGKQGLSAMPAQTIPQLFHECCKRYANLPALVFENVTSNSVSSPSSSSSETTNKPPATSWTTLTYADYAQKVEQAALILLHIGLQPRSSVGILAFNCPEWFYTEFGALRAGGVVAGIYPSNSAEAVFHVLDTSEATVCIVDDAQQMAKLRSIKSRLPRLHAVVQLHGPFDDFVGVDDGYYKWEDLICMQLDNALRTELELRERDVGVNECAMLIYTSGTVGMPKAVMLSHDSIIYDTKAVAAMLPDVVEGAETTVTYLPLNHIAAQVFDVFLVMLNGGCVFFADKNALKGSLSKTLCKARPTRMFGVPRIYEKIHEKLNTVHTNSSVFARYLMDKSRQTVEQYHIDKMKKKTPSSFSYWLASKVTRRVKIALGLDRCKTFFVGGAPVLEETKRFFLSLDMPLQDVYGMSESSGATTMHMELTDFENCGRALEGIELKIYNPNSEGHGEICVRGRNCFMGYLHELAKTKETIKDDGWLHSGDVGYINTAGSLIISGRIKELVITAGGENIPPVYIEGLVKRELPCISNAVVVGDKKKYLTILLTLKTDFDPETGMPLDTLNSEAIDWLQTLGLNFNRLSEVLSIPTDIRDLDASNVEVKPHPDVVKAIEEGIKRANVHSISNAQKVQKFSILPHDFSIPTGELGPTLKLRRNIILQKYASIIERMYK